MPGPHRKRGGYNYKNKRLVYIQADDLFRYVESHPYT